jgi:hypothetical protein
VQIAVAAPHVSACAARHQQGLDLIEQRSTGVRQPRNPVARKELRHFPERFFVLTDVGSERSRCCRAVPQSCPCVGSQDRTHQFCEQGRSEIARVRNVIKRRTLVEAAHVHRPLDYLAVASERQCRSGPCDRFCAEIDSGSAWPVDLDLGLAG